jgi:hypothetical protein
VTGRLRVMIGAIALGLAAATMLLPARELALEVAAGDRIVWRTAVEKGEAFDVSFTHSSERCRWTQHYRARARGIDQTASTFACFGPGMPAAGAATRSAAGYTVAASRRLGEIPMLNWQAAQIAITHRGRTRPIGGELADFEPFRVRVR